MNYLERGGERELTANAVILSAVEGSRHVTFKLSQRDPSTSLGMTISRPRMRVGVGFL
jgi:hypothetical protein